MAHNIRRRSRRYPFRKRVKYGKDEPRYTGHTLNLNRHGTIVEASRLYPPGTDLSMVILDSLNGDSSSDNSIFLNVRVVWAEHSIGNTQRGKMGIEFLTLPSEVEKYYNARASREVKKLEEV